MNPALDDAWTFQPSPQLRAELDELESIVSQFQKGCP
jgi:hypothetical protein